MSFSLDTISAQTLKSEAKALREERARQGEPLTQGAALEAVAQAHGYRDWNTARAMLPDRVAAPLQVGHRVRGTYLGQNFRGLMLGVQLLVDMRHYQVTVLFDEPVDVVTSDLFSAFRQRVTATVDIHGVSPALLGNGRPQMRVARE
ncbi:glyoxalase superfamily protein [Devosia sp. RR2S18]|uniref:glyoxalase superfamily protein n=1 Tax=Devosia rhizosphaerae TaxID=3049774 RepID=UPI00253FC407|nr:glyoxalase superfamily protein [Devosia sp. RR2S18]WIJ24162.1 glyoxalase superfamily protein [Devosia sp. RR2S18]